MVLRPPTDFRPPRSIRCKVLRQSRYCIVGILPRRNSHAYLRTRGGDELIGCLRYRGTVDSQNGYSWTHPQPISQRPFANQANTESHRGPVEEHRIGKFRYVSGTSYQTWDGDTSARVVQCPGSLTAPMPARLALRRCRRRAP